ncbi:hypothetical protein RclHR1_03640002 [Rhizophagus clarus]|uniref:HMG box domain-containing protein n=1 Tax=Rhizophagus clarus TaxID=94130 RepID=A0A2Z6S6F2_9GLOM|nr:hypothetical protein RclHR1_03640002 [Rhizophagus clarus]GES76248.1 hypothetical protein GLOIN_2v1771727 [Rhizophagus clarus]
MKTPKNRNPSRPANGFSMFVKYYTRKYKNQVPQERFKNASCMWKSLPNEVKNNFTKYAHDEHVLKKKPPVIPIHADGFEENHKQNVFIFDVHSTKPFGTNHEVSDPNTPSSFGEEFFDFEKYFNDNF